MLKFDSEHKSINGSLKNSNNKLKMRNFIAGGMLVASIFLFGGCAKNVDCDIKGLHAHNYVNEESFDKYMISEKEHNGKWVRTNSYVEVSHDMKELIDFENKEKLFRISHNKDKIKEIVDSQEDYIEYRYRYTYLLPIAHSMYNGKTTTVYYTYIPQTGYSWTDNPAGYNLTGEQRVVHHVYYGYKVAKNSRGKYEAIRSELVDNIEDLDGEFIYIKEKFYKKVNPNDKTIEFDYEDGPAEEKMLDEEQQAEYEQQLESERSKTK